MGYAVSPAVKLLCGSNLADFEPVAQLLISQKFQIHTELAISAVCTFMYSIVSEASEASEV